MARTTISISDELKARMDAVEEPVNWSQIAAAAYELKLGELAEAKKQKSMADVISRLRASKIESANHSFLDGVERGMEWAKNHASFDALSCLAEQRERKSDWFAEGSDVRLGPAQVAALTSRADFSDEFTSDEIVEAFWHGQVFESDELSRTEVDERITNPEWLRSFVVGAAEIYKMIADRL